RVFLLRALPLHRVVLLLFFLILPRPPCPTLFPYTTLFRSLALLRAGTAFELLRRADSLGVKASSSYGRQASLEAASGARANWSRSEEHTSEFQSLTNLVCRLLLEKKKNKSYD